MSKHSTLGPSAAHRWARCPGSVRMQRGLPRMSSPWAREGTGVHEIASWCLRDAFGTDDGLEFFDPASITSPFQFIGAKMLVEGQPFEFTQEHAALIQPGLDWIALQNIDVIEVETWVDLTEWLGDDPEDGSPQGGMLDIAWIDERGLLVVIFDWKIGQEPVEVRDNWQLLLYALGFYKRHRERIDLMACFGAVTFRLVIEQPRVAGGGDSWFVQLDEIREFGRWIAKRALETRGSETNLVPGLKQCRWCAARASAKCRAYDDFMLKFLGDKLPDFVESGVGPKTPMPSDALARELSPKARGWLLKHKTAIVAWLEGHHAAALADAEHGLPTPGQKMIRGRSPNREWLGEDRARDTLETWRLVGAIESEYEPRKLLSPAKVEEALGRKVFRDNFSGLISQGEGKLILVDENDKGEVVEPLVNRLPDFVDGDDIPF